MDKKRGFSLIEFIVSLSVVFIVAAIIMPRYRLLSTKSALLSASYELSQRLRETQEMALSGESIEVVPGSWEIPSGYGIFLDIDNDSQYIIYADLSPGNGEYDGEPVDKIVEVVELDSDLSVASIVHEISSYFSVSVNTTPPEPSTQITAEASDLTGVTIGLSAVGVSQDRLVIVNKAGLIYVE